MINTPESQDADNLILLISDNERICLDAYIFNSANKLNAYKLYKGITKDIDIITLQQRANKWIQNKANQAYIDKYKSVIININSPDNKNDAENGDTNLDKDAIIHQLSVLIPKTNDIKLKAELLIKLNDIKGYKKDILKTESETKRIYLPERCLNCDFKRFYTENQ